MMGHCVLGFLSLEGPPVQRALEYREYVSLVPSACGWQGEAGFSSASVTGKDEVLGTQV